MLKFNESSEIKVDSGLVNRICIKRRTGRKRGGEALRSANVRIF